MEPEPLREARSRPMSDADVAELDRLLATVPAERHPLDVAMLDGFLAALQLLPGVVAPEAWLPFVFDAQGRAVVLPGEPATRRRAVDLVLRRYDELGAYIAAREPFEPVIFELLDEEGNALAGRDAIAALEPWAEGFVNALTAFPALHDRLGGDDVEPDTLGAILRHLPVDPDDPSEESRVFAEEEADFERDYPLADLDEAIEALVAAVLDIADVTRPRRPVERATPKVGRNDPCPCGSGRKYKHCHGGAMH